MEKELEKKKEPEKKKRILWMFRTNLRPLEYYHRYKHLDEFKSRCHDFYLLMCLWYLENDFVDEVYVWRLKPQIEYHRYEDVRDIVFNVAGKSFIQKFVSSFYECLDNPKYKEVKPTISFFRGGFPEYCAVTKRQPAFFGNSLYLGAGRRVYPQYGGRYRKLLVESDEDLKHSQTFPFFKTANRSIFHPVENRTEKYDLCWICNFSEINFKGQEYFINEVSKSEFLKGIKIIHIGNQPEKGIDLCEKSGVSNINFLGYLTRPEVNKFLNESKLAIITSNENDGSPRVVTEILMSGTPLIIRAKTRLLSFYKERGVIEFSDSEVDKKIEEGLSRSSNLKKEVLENISNISIGNICNINFKLWNQ